MRVPLKWLREYVDIDMTPEDLAHRLTMGGVEVAGIEKIGAGWDRDKILVGQVRSLAPHPNADRLQLVTADYGRGAITVVTGAFNLAVGDKVPVALLGARLLNGHSDQHEEIVLKPVKLRGVPSEGMVCSALELGLGQDHSGIMILPADAPLGMPLADYMGDVIFELEIKGRWDCLSMLGVAQDVAAIETTQLGRDTPVRQPPTDYAESDPAAADLITIEIADPHLCPRYSATVVRGITVGPSPRWLQERLAAAGMRPINNIVDITNYVMWETGQPLHAFDYDKLHGRRIIVRRADKGETLVSLDGQVRELTRDMLLIADAKRAVAIAGVMGGLDTEVTETTTNILLESANFQAVSVRRTAQALQIPSEAQRRFEKGLPAGGTALAARRATRLMVELAGGQAARGVADAYPRPQVQPTILLTSAEVERVLGVALPQQRVRWVLESLACRCEPQGDSALLVTPPLRRVDIGIPADLIEEVARILGYDSMPTTMIRGEIPTERLAGPDLYWEERVRDVLVGCGYSEVIAYSLVSQRLLERLQPAGSPPGGEDNNVPESVQQRLLGAGVTPIRLANPMTADMEYLRTTAVPSLLELLSRNLRHEDRDVAIFEVGRVYHSRGQDLPDERRTLTIASGEYRSARSWGRRERIDFFDVKGAAEAVVRCLGLRNRGYSASYHAAVHPAFHPGRLALIVAEQSGHKGRPAAGAGDAQNVIGLLGEVHPAVAAAFDIKERAYVLAMDLGKMIELAAWPEAQTFAIKPLPRFPAVVQDMAIVIDETVPAAQVESLVRRAGGNLVAGVQLFDVYTGDPIPAGKKSLAYSITYQAADRTLTGEEAGDLHARIEKRLGQELGATLRK